MSNIPDRPNPVNAPSPGTILGNQLGDLRNQAMAAWALSEAVNDALEALPPGTVDERILMLGALCEEKCGAVFQDTESLAKQPR